MQDPQTKADLIERLGQVQRALTGTLRDVSDTQFNTGTSESWSAAGYLKHLILTVKPLAKALKLPPDQLHTMFGQPDHASRSYAEVVSTYKSRLAEGVRAEDYNNATPAAYRLPEDVEDEQQYLVQTWNDSNDRLLEALQSWSDADLDKFQLPHPAIGAMTLREMLFFTLYHNTLHWHDIQHACQLPSDRMTNQDSKLRIE